MNITEFARLGGKARWKGKTKKQRKEAMSKLGRFSAKKRKVKKMALIRGD